VSGDTPKRMLVRAIGPGLAGLGVSGTLANPNLLLYRGSSIINQNDDWGNNAEAAAAAAQVGALPLPAGSLDSALVATLSPGIYTAVVGGVNASSGVALAEVFDLDVPEPFTAQKVLNLSTRGDVGTGDRVLVAGFVVNGSSAKRVLIRAAGPALGALGVSGTLADPFLRIFQGTTAIRENDNWESGNNLALLLDAAAKSGAFAFPTGGKDAAVLLTLPRVATARRSGCWRHDGHQPGRGLRGSVKHPVRPSVKPRSRAGSPASRAGLLLFPPRRPRRSAAIPTTPALGSGVTRPASRRGNRRHREREPGRLCSALPGRHELPVPAAARRTRHAGMPLQA
jgi:hypothetical protein